MKKVNIGNDELILYYRKNEKNPCSVTTVFLGRLLWIEVRRIDKKAEKVKGGKPRICRWGDGEGVGRYMLPRRATQFSVNADCLPELFMRINEFANK